MTEFSLNETDGDTRYLFKIHLVPNYTSVTIGANATVIPRATEDGTGGLVVFRCKGDVNIQGKILTSSYGMLRQDYFQMTHNHLPERFITAGGGGVIILSEGTLTAGDNARIGASWSGAGKGGAAKTGKGISGNPGGSGYGGSGGIDAQGSDRTSTVGGVGGGGAGHANGRIEGLSPGTSKPGTGGGVTWSLNGAGCQGVTLGGAGYRNQCGGGAVGDGSTYSNGRAAYSGSCVMIICKKLKISMDAISTGGEGGGQDGWVARGGGGCGMCYLAYEEAE